jgi:L-ribulokinase
VLPGLWCCEAGQAAFGDMLAWYVRTFPRSNDLSENFALHNQAAAALGPGGGGVIALDWFLGNRIPLADSRLSGLLLGLNLQTTSAGVYLALVESLCFGTNSILELALEAGVPIERIVLTSGLATNNPFLIQTMANVFGRIVEVPEIDNPTALGAALHGAVAAGVVPDFAAAAARFGAHRSKRYLPDGIASAKYRALYAQYRRLAADNELQSVMHSLHELGTRWSQARINAIIE